MGALTQLRLHELLHYDANTGDLIWKITRSLNAMAGAKAGCCKKSDGYVYVRVEQKAYAAHRLAWLHVHGVWPTHCLDHINGNRADNRFVNLRPATVKQNGENRKKRRNSKSGYKGVSWSNAAQKWVAQICHHGKRKHLGLFIDPKKAHETYLVAANALFTHADRNSQE